MRSVSRPPPWIGEKFADGSMRRCHRPEYIAEMVPLHVVIPRCRYLKRARGPHDADVYQALPFIGIESGIHVDIGRVMVCTRRNRGLAHIPTVAPVVVNSRLSPKGRGPEIRRSGQLGRYIAVNALPISLRVVGFVCSFLARTSAPARRNLKHGYHA